MFFIGPNHGIPWHHLCKFAPKNDKFHEILAKKTEFSDARKSWIKKILLHAKNQLFSSKNENDIAKRIFGEYANLSGGFQPLCKVGISPLTFQRDNTKENELMVDF